MKKLLRRNEKEAIRNKFGILPIFQLLLPTGKKNRTRAECVPFVRRTDNYRNNMFIRQY